MYCTEDPLVPDQLVFLFHTNHFVLDQFYIQCEPYFYFYDRVGDEDTAT